MSEDWEEDCGGSAPNAVRRSLWIAEIQICACARVAVKPCEEKAAGELQDSPSSLLPLSSNSLLLPPSDGRRVLASHQEEDSPAAMATALEVVGSQEAGAEVLESLPQLV